MQILKTSERSFEKRFQQILSRSVDPDPKIERTVQKIIDDVRRRGDRALLQYTTRFDRFRPDPLEVSPREIAAALRQVGRRELADLKLAARRIRNFHRRQVSGRQVSRSPQVQKSWSANDGGILTGEIVRPIERVGIYVPGGKAAYPSTVLMNAIPASVAGVSEICMVTPWPDGVGNPSTLAAADLVGVKRIFKVGGAQAIAALAYGTESVPAVDKIVGPGNLYVAAAKRLVFGKVGIDMIAGPTEIVIIADESARADWVAADLISQAEHDENALPILLTPSAGLIKKVMGELRRQSALLTRKSILTGALKRRGLCLLTRNLPEAVQLANRIAPEHLELAVKNPGRWLFYVKNAGAIFLGNRSPVAFGDYVAGPNHVLPTGRSARFSSPLGVADFQRRSSLIEVDGAGLKKLGPSVIRLAEIEGLTAHAASVRLRLASD